MDCLTSSKVKPSLALYLVVMKLMASRMPIFGISPIMACMRATF